MKQMSTKQPTTKGFSWDDPLESFVKIFIYTLASLYYAQSLMQYSTSWLSIGINSLLLYLGLWSIVSEISFAVDRARRHLPPGRIGFPVLGEMPIILGVYKGNIKEYWIRRLKKYGTVQMVRTILRSIILMDRDSLDWLWNIDRKRFLNSSNPPHVARLVGASSILSVDRQTHRKLRRIMEPFFTPVFVKKYFQNIVDISQKELTKWSSSGQFQSSNVFKLFTLRVLFTVALGSVNEDMIMKIHDQFAIWFSGFISSVGANRVPGLAFDKGMKARECILGHMQELIDEFKAKYDENSEHSKSTIMGQMIYSRDKDGNCLSMDEIKDNMLTLMFAGHDTTFAAISSCLYYISQYPKAHEALLNEISSFRSPLDHDEIRQAPVLNAIMYEVLRIDPPVAGAFRRVNQDVRYKDYSFKKGTSIRYGITGTVHNDDIFPNATSFHFERFLPKDHPLYDASWASDVDAGKDRSAYPVFGGGTRVCLGQNFAKMEIRIMLTLLLRDYKLEVKNGRNVVLPINRWMVDFKLTKKA